MKIGIPRALLYFKNEKFWTTYFNEIGVLLLNTSRRRRE
ncbi:MAG: hypothetical protein K2N52_01325 [Clostridia bacterium]|nr:hypothetical protein [Clostridia bacterium]